MANAGFSDVREKEEMEWMYQGTSAIINPDDYLSGKKLDRNFELYATEVKKEPPTKIDLVVAKPLLKNVKMLDVDTIRKEDPLVAIKVREERAKREMMANPVKMKQLQSLILAAMEKKMKKHRRKEKKSRRSRSSSDEKDDSGGGRRHRSDEKRHRRDSPAHATTSRSRDRRERSKSEEKRHRSREKKHQRHGRSRSVSNERRKPEGYGLVHPKGIDVTVKPAPIRSTSKEEPKYIPKPAVVLPKPVVRSKMSEEERLKRLREMEENAKWRDSQRKKNVTRLETEEKLEEKELSDHRGRANFVKPLLAQAAETGSVEQRLKSNIYKIQRSHDAMHSSFTTK